MINIVTELPKDNYILDASSYFDANVPLSTLDDVDRMILKEVDNSELVDINTGLVQSRFGVTSIKNISAGCKVILVYRYLVKNHINAYLTITECGANALEVLFCITEKDGGNTDNTFVLWHANGIRRCKPRDYVVNGIGGRNLWDLL